MSTIAPNHHALPPTSAQRALARQYSPLRDPEPPNYLRHMTKVAAPLTVRIFRRNNGNRVIEWRGQISGGNTVFGGEESLRKI
jgi:hypothetical protein